MASIIKQKLTKDRYLESLSKLIDLMRTNPIDVTNGSIKELELQIEEYRLRGLEHIAALEDGPDANNNGASVEETKFREFLAESREVHQKWSKLTG